MRIAFVCPFFGHDASGGAEFAARSLALHLAAAEVQVEILTTCLLDLPHGITENVHAEGATADGPLTVRRFPVEKTDMRHFGTLNELIISGTHLTIAEERQFMTRHVTSPGMIRYLATHEQDYDRFVFIPYLFGTTCFGVMAVPHKSIVIPCFHDEGYARLQLVQRMVDSAHRLVFNVPAEQRFAMQQFKLPPARCETIGLGIDTDIVGDAERFRQRFDLRVPFLLYAGRRDTTKNVHTLIDYFLRYKQQHPGPLKLVLIGAAPLPVASPHPDLVDLGFVSEQEKHDAYAAATLFCQPSLNESFSYVMMEAWLCGTACLVHEDCEVTRDHVVESGGGLFFKDASDFGAAVERLLDDNAMRLGMAAAGCRYVHERYAWPRVVDRFKAALAV